MERRTLLAIILMVAVFAIYNYIFFSGQEPAPPATELESQGEVLTQEGAGEDAAAPAASESREPQQKLTDALIDSLRHREASGGEIKSVRVKTPLQEIQLSGQGGTITSLKLVRYEGPDEGAVELIPDGGRALSVSLGIGSERIQTGSWVFSADRDSLVLGSDEQGAVRLTAGGNGLFIEKTYVFYGDRYDFELGVSMSGVPVRGLGGSYRIEWGSGLAVTEENRSGDLDFFKASALVDDGVISEGLKSVAQESRKELARPGRVSWVSTQTKYFIAAIVPDGTAERAVFWGDWTKEGRKAVDGWVAVALERELTGQSADANFQVYAGPMDYQTLAEFADELEQTVNMGWAVFRPVSRLILGALQLGHKWIPNYGVVIILLSILTKVLFYRLTHKSFVSMHKMQQLQPKLQKLKEKHGNDKQKLNQATMELYKNEQVNPMGGCLPLLLQMPVFIALYQVLRSTIELRNAHFVAWVTDLSQPESLFEVGGFPIRLIPLLMGLSMFLQEKFRVKDPRQAMMTYMMPIVMTVILYNFPSGLTLYWLVNNILTIAQQQMIQRSLAVEVEESA
jgi:YidC/Oxa1 family membrane protein insertase